MGPGQVWPRPGTGFFLPCLWSGLRKEITVAICHLFGSTSVTHTQPFFSFD